MTEQEAFFFSVLIFGPLGLTVVFLVVQGVFWIVDRILMGLDWGKE